MPHEMHARLVVRLSARVILIMMKSFGMSTRAKSNIMKSGDSHLLESNRDSEAETWLLKHSTTYQALDEESA